MGGVAQQVPKVAKEIVKPVQQAAQAVGVTSRPAPQAAPAAAAPQPAATAQPTSAVAAARDEAENTLTRRRMRRAGRALLSEARLNPEQGIQSTLGAGPSL